MMGFANAQPILQIADARPSHRPALQQFDRDPLRAADEAHPHARAHRGRLLGELDALAFEFGGDRVDAGNRQPEMVEALIGRGRRRVDAVAGLDRRDEDVGAAELEIDARLALLHAADDLGAEHALEPLRGCLWVRAAQVDVIPGVGWHFGFSSVYSASAAQYASLLRPTDYINPHIARPP